MSGFMTKTSKGFRFRTSVLAVALACAPALGEAAGMGKLNVYSTLGQPLRAEIELSATPEELNGMTARLASPDSYKQAGMDFSPTLLGLRFNVEKRGENRSVIRLSSDRPINDPFVDVLLELNWGAGRLVREYTFLLDPPEVNTKVSPAVASAAAVAAPARNEASAPAADTRTARPEKTEKAEPRKKTRADAESGDKENAKTAVRTAKVKAQAAAESSTFAGNDGDVTATRPVKKGDTLAAIAAEIRPEGVTLEQMLVSLFRANPDSFDGGNMNRLRAGTIIGVPGKQAIEAVSPEEAKQIMRAQAKDWQAYRRKLADAVADAPAREESAGQAAAGRITPKVDEPKAAQAARDQVKVGKADVGKDATGKPGAKAALEEDLIAKDKALKDAQQRMASLEKNVADLQKLLEMKNQGMADLQKQAAGKQAGVAAPVTDTAKAAEKPVEKMVDKAAEKAADKPVEKSADKPQDTSRDKTAEAAAPVAPPADPNKPSGETFPIDKAAVPPAPAPEVAKPVAPPPPAPAPVAPPSFLDELLGSPLQLGGMAAAILAGIGGLLVARRRRAEKEEAPVEAIVEPAAPVEAAPVVETTDIPTVAATASAEFSQAGPGAIDTDDVDPVAEADVYIAYGRDEQAEEILLEARQRDPGRFSILGKLLEIYAKRGDLSNYAATASALRDATGGAGEEWRQAAETGARLDPANPLYGSAGAASASVPVDVPEIPASEPAVDDLTSLDFELSLNDAPAVAPEVAEPAVVLSEPASDSLAEFAPEPVMEPVAESVPEAPVDDSNTLDFDLDLAGAAEPVAAAPSEEPAAPVVDDGNALDFDFELPTTAAAPTEPEELAAPEVAAELPADDGNTLQFDPAALALDTPVAEAVAEEEAPAAPVNDDTVLDFSFDDLPAAEPAAQAAEPVAETAAEMTSAASADEELLAFDLPEVAEVADASAPVAEVPAESPAAMVDLDRLDPVPMSDELAADLARIQSMQTEAEQAVADADTLLDFDLGTDLENQAAAETTADADTLLDLPPLDQDASPVDELPPPPFDLSSISLDLEVAPADVADKAEDAAVESEIALEVPDIPPMPELSELPEVAETLAEEAPTEGHDSDLLQSIASSVAAEEVDLSAFETAAEPALQAVPVPEAGEESVASEEGPRWQEVETKLDLAKAYEEMGDVEGARELLAEVIGEGDAAQQDKARSMLERIIS